LSLTKISLTRLDELKLALFSVQSNKKGVRWNIFVPFLAKSFYLQDIYRIKKKLP